MAKAIYGRVFGWIVNKINCLLAPEEAIPEDQLKEIGQYVQNKEHEQEGMFYLTTHSTHFIYGYMASDIW